MTPEQEARILALACARSLLTPEQAARATAGGGEAVRFGPRIDRLLDAGLLSEELLEALAWEAERTPGGFSPHPIAPDSWVGPGLGAIFPSTPADPTLSAWGRYQGLDLLAVGGAGKVYSALDPLLGRRVALKLLKSSLPGHAERLLKEARAQAQVDHPNVCKIYEAGSVEDRPYISMQLVLGRTLAQAADRLPLRQRVEVMRDVAEAVHTAHRAGLVHLDLKPGNILLEILEKGRPHPYVTDFGLVQEEGPRDFLGPVGTPPFASPEQLSGNLRDIDRRSDVYALGVSIYAVACGNLPYDHRDAEELARATVAEAPVPLRRRDPDLPEDLAWIAARCMEKDRERRYGSALALAEDLQRFLDGEPVHARPRTFRYRLSAWVRRHRALALAAAVAVLAVLGAAGTSLAVNRRAAAQARLAQHFGQRVEHLRALIRYAHLQAAHDIRPEMEQAARAMEELGADMDRAGSAGRAPGLHALGRGSLALGRPEEALARFRQALAAGERGPELQTDLGLALGILYARGLKEAQGLRPPAQRQQRLSALRRELKAPALDHLRLGRIGKGPEGTYAEALIAAFEGRGDEALSRIAATLAGAPWFYEGLLLEIKLGLTESLHRNPLEAAEQSRDLGHLDALGRTTERLLRLAPSLPEAYFLEADRWYERGRILEGSDAAGSDSAFRTGLAWADRGLAVDARNADLLVVRSRHLWVLGEKAQRSGREPGDAFSEARRSADLAAEVEPGRGYVFRNRANVLAAQASWLSSTGKDPTEAVAAGLASLERALALDGRDLSGLRSLAWLQGFRADALRTHRQDPRPAYRAAVEVYEEILRLEGEDPMATANGGLMYGILFELDLEEGRADPALVERGLALLERGLNRSPRNVIAWANQAFLLRLRARQAREAGQDPAPYLERGRTSAGRAQALATPDPAAFYEHGFLELEAARCELGVGRDPVPALLRAEVLFRSAGKKNPRESDVWRGLAEAALLRTDRAAARPSTAVLAAGMAHARQALELNPGNHVARLVLGGLALHQARASSGEAARRWARTAVEALDRALGEAPECARTWRPRQEAARRLAGA